jgi:hypothetical protein
MLRTVAVALMLAAAVGPVAAFEAEVQRYHDLMAHVCRTGITPRLVAAYEQARLAVEKAQYGGGRSNNFWGLKTPEQAWLDCVQSPDGRE